MLFLSACTKKIVKDWDKTMDRNTIDAYEQFIQKYPDSEYTVEANQHINHIKAIINTREAKFRLSKKLKQLYEWYNTEIENLTISVFENNSIKTYAQLYSLTQSFDGKLDTLIIEQGKEERKKENLLPDWYAENIKDNLFNSQIALIILDSLGIENSYPDSLRLVESKRLSLIEKLEPNLISAINIKLKKINDWMTVEINNYKESENRLTKFEKWSKPHSLSVGFREKLDSLRFEVTGKPKSICGWRNGLTKQFFWHKSTRFCCFDSVTSSDYADSIITREQEIDNLLLSVTLRSTPTTLSEEDVLAMLKEKGFYDVDWNNGGKGVPNNYELCKDGKVVYDKVTNLMWQTKGLAYLNASGAINENLGGEVKKILARMNSEKYGGFDDWRAPTLEEAMSLMKPDRKQILYMAVYTSDDYTYIRNFPIWGERTMRSEWFVNFKTSRCTRNRYEINFTLHLCAVRSATK